MSLSPYDELIDLANERGWHTELDYDKKGWRLDIRDKGDLIARAHSTKPRPACFRDLAVGAAAALAKGRRIGGSGSQ
jgi:hypothetical protein